MTMGTGPMPWPRTPGVPGQHAACYLPSQICRLPDSHVIAEGALNVKHRTVFGDIVALPVMLVYDHPVSAESCLAAAFTRFSPPLLMSAADDGPVYEPIAIAFTVNLADPL